MTTRYQNEHYEDVAILMREALQGIGPSTTPHRMHEDLVQQFSVIFEGDHPTFHNPNFDRERFLAACGLESEPNNPAYHSSGEPHMHPSPADHHAHPPKFHTAHGLESEG